jgi:hypothetical protein
VHNQELVSSLHNIDHLVYLHGEPVGPAVRLFRTEQVVAKPLKELAIMTALV